MAFTIVFEGAVRDLPSNPFKMETAFGKVVAVSVGDLTEKIEAIHDLHEAAARVIAADEDE